MKLKRYIYLLYIAAASSYCEAGPVPTEQAYRSFENTSGVVIRAKITATTEDTVSLRREDGMEFRDVSLDLFSEADRLYISAWHVENSAAAAMDLGHIHPDSRIEMSFLKRLKEDPNLHGKEGEVIGKMSPVLVLHNEELNQPYQAVEGTLIIIGKGLVDEEDYVVLNRQDFKVDLPAGKSVNWNGEPFEWIYHPDENGFEYEGYLVVLKDAKGAVVLSKSTKSEWEMNASTAVKAEPSKCYAGDLSYERTLYSKWGLPW